MGTPESRQDPDAPAQHRGATPATNRTGPEGDRRKLRGAYYTDLAVARFLVRWAVRTGSDTVLDPSFGAGVLLTSAAERIGALGGDPGPQVYGIEIDDRAYESFRQAASTLGLPRTNFLHSDFFQVSPEDLPQVDVLVGNPPFIRYQRFAGAARELALKRAAEAGVKLTQLSSAWAPFLVCAGRFVKAGGRLAVVAPGELLHAAYARPVLQHLRCSFSKTRILSFRHKLFPELSEDTVLVLAEGRGGPDHHLELIQLNDVLDLEVNDVLDLEGGVDQLVPLSRGIRVDPNAVESGRERLIGYLLPPHIWNLYREIESLPRVTRIGNICDVSIGYVTGDNGFFHLSAKVAEEWEIPGDLLRRAVCRGRDLSGIRFTEDDWVALQQADRSTYLLTIPDVEERDLPRSVQRYLAEGKLKGVPERYKCRTRNRWYSVPGVRQEDALLTYMAGAAPKLVANQAAVVAPNTLHVLRIHPLFRSVAASPSLAVSWHTSLTAISAEIEGHSLGGGLLKLEPTEAERVLIVNPSEAVPGLDDLGVELDRLYRCGKDKIARDLADEHLLRNLLGLSSPDIAALREGSVLLRERRLHVFERGD